MPVSRRVGLNTPGAVARSRSPPAQAHPERAQVARAGGLRREVVVTSVAVRSAGGSLLCTGTVWQAARAGAQLLVAVAVVRWVQASVG